ncbi:putative pentatricopeptide repeat-containing protein [Raphanus sativus]|nr:putative pentatricopeptide repeat-containing protein [Raphanus sativus]
MVCSPKLVTYTSLIKGCVGYEMVDEVCSVLSVLQSKDSKKLVRDLDLRITIGTSLEMDLVMGNSLINYLCKVGNTAAALRVFRNMSSKDLALDCHTYTGFLTALCQGKAPRDAQFHTMIINILLELCEYSAAIRLFKPMRRGETSVRWCHA